VLRDSARQEAETWRSLQQFSRNALELSQKRLDGQGPGDTPLPPQPHQASGGWLTQLWCELPGCLLQHMQQLDVSVVDIVYSVAHRVRHWHTFCVLEPSGMCSGCGLGRLPVSHDKVPMSQALLSCRR